MTNAHDICIDVSHYQGVIDWPAVRGAGILIAMIKATEGATFRDPMFAKNRSAADAAGIAVIPYHFLRPASRGMQERLFAATADLARDMPFALDWEAPNAATVAQAEEVGAYLSEITGRLPLGYWGIPGAQPDTPTAAMLTWPRWIPRYPAKGVTQWTDLPAVMRADPLAKWVPDKLTDAASRMLFAQYTDSGKVAGISGNVDRSVAFFDTPELAVAWVRAGNIPAPIPQPDPTYTLLRELTTQIQTITTQMFNLIDGEKK